MDSVREDFSWQPLVVSQAEKEGSNQEKKALQETKLGHIKNRSWDHNQPVAIQPG